jgi:hypothetical protein
MPWCSTQLKQKASAKSLCVFTELFSQFAAHPSSSFAFKFHILWNFTRNFVLLPIHTHTSVLSDGCAIAEAVSRRCLTTEARIRSQASPYGIYCGQSGTGTGFSPSTSVPPYQFHSTGTHYTQKRIVQE